MKKLVCFFLLSALLFSCDRILDYQECSDGNIAITAYTLEPAQLQGSMPSTSTIEIKKGSEIEKITYDTYGVNNIDIKIFADKIFIIPLDRETASLLIQASGLKPIIFGYTLMIDTRLKK